MKDEDVVAYFAAYMQLHEQGQAPVLGIESDAAPENDERDTGGEA